MPQQVEFVKPVSPYNAGEIASVADDFAKSLIESSYAKPYEAAEEKKVAKKAEPSKVE